MGDFDHWDYRVLRRTTLTATGEDQSFELIEVDYDKHDKITAWARAAPGGHNLKALEADLRRMTKAAWYAVLRAEGKRFLTEADLPASNDGDQRPVYVTLRCAKGHEYLGPDDAPKRREACPSCGEQFDGTLRSNEGGGSVEA